MVRSIDLLLIQVLDHRLEIETSSNQRVWMREAPLDQKNPWFPGVFRPQRTLSPSLKEMFKQPSSPLYGQFHVHGPGSNARLIDQGELNTRRGR